MPPGPAVIVDIDGTLSDTSHRLRYLTGRRKNWDAFFDAAERDPPLAGTIALVDALDRALAVLLITGRPARTGELTIEWLTRHAVRWDLLALRPDGDYRPATAWKGEVVDALARSGWELRLAIEDDAAAVKAYAKRGIPSVELRSDRG